MQYVRRNIQEIQKIFWGFEMSVKGYFFFFHAFRSITVKKKLKVFF